MRKIIRKVIIAFNNLGTNMVKSYRTKIAHIGFTSRCNLKCVFCVASQPQYRGVDLDEGLIDNISESLKNRDVDIVSVNGHGETTIYKNWDYYCDKLIDYKMPLHIISNFSKKLSNAEVRTFSFFRSIEVSCDSTDAELFAKLRRGASLDVLTENIKKIVDLCNKENKKHPIITFSCVVSNKNVLGLKDYVKYGNEIGVKGFNFCNLTKFPDVSGAFNVDHVSTMNIDFVRKADIMIKDSFEYLKKNNINFSVQQGLTDSIKNKLKTTATKPSFHEEHSKESPSYIRFSSSKEEGQTRDCLDPWKFVQIDPNKAVLACCWSSPIGNLDSGKTLDEILNDIPIVDLRKELLAGKLNNFCKDCPSRGLTDLISLNKKVKNYLSLKPKKIKYNNQANKYEPEIKYISGWYDEELDESIIEKDFAKWRWSKKNAFISIKNPGEKVLLAIWGAHNKLELEDQNIFINLNGKNILKFIPVTSKFFKEILLTGETLGSNELINIEFEVNETFNPSKNNPEIHDDRDLGVRLFKIFIKKI